VRVEGPDTLAEGETGTYTAVTSGFDDDVTVRWQAGELRRTVERSFTPGTHDVVVTATDGDGTFLADKTVHVGRNAPPKVSIEDPGDIDPGESIVLSLAELRDPDGTVTTVSWTEGEPVASVHGTDTVRSVTVPRGNGSTRVEVTAVDDDGVSATDVIVVSSTTDVVQSQREVSTTRVAQCTYYEFASRESGQPIRCWSKSTGEVIYDRDPNEGPEDTYDPHSHPNFVVEWYRVGVPADDSIKPGTARAKRAPAAESPIQHANSARAENSPPKNESVTEIQRNAETNSGLEPYERNGQTVETDLNDDGDVDLQDWQERFGDPAAQNIDNDVDKVQTLKSESEERADTTGSADSGSGLSDTLKDAFDGISESVDSILGTGSDSNTEDNSSSEGVVEKANDAVSDVTEAFEDLTSVKSSSKDSDSSESDSGQKSGSSGGTSSDSCTETALGWEVRL